MLAFFLCNAVEAQSTLCGAHVADKQSAANDNNWNSSRMLVGKL